MKLRGRIVLVLVTIVFVLVVPASLGWLALTQLQGVAQSLRARDAVGALALGRLQAALASTEFAERAYVALATDTTDERRAQVRDELLESTQQVESLLALLRGAGYERPAAPAANAWSELDAAIEESRELVDMGAVSAADSVRAARVIPGFAAMDAALDPIGVAINEASQAQVERAQQIAEAARLVILLSLAAALTLAIALGAWLTRSLVRPIHDLQRGMAVVAEGEFAPKLEIQRDRPDELGDLARSFESMADQLAELDRLKAEFVSIASHELKTPLSVIRGYLTLLHDGFYGEVDEEQREIMRASQDQTDRLARLIQQLLDVSRLEAGGGRLEKQLLEVQDFLAQLAKSFEVLAVQNDVDFSFEIANDAPPRIEADPERLDEVLGNLLSNAFKFTPRGGQIRLRAVPVDGRLGVEVTDTGVGIPPEHLDSIFDKFYQVENTAQPRSVGSGLGLAIAREIVEAHGGTIAAESEPGRGTTLRVTLPAESSTNGRHRIHG